MKKLILLSMALMFVISLSKAQTTAMQFSGMDCDGNAADLFADLDAGKAVILHFYMPNCGSCPPPAQKIQAMASKINSQFPGKVKGYAFPFQNTTTCTYSSTWVSSNGLSALYVPMDSGATQVAYYGGFGMPTVVLLGGADHRVMFSTMSFATSDTTQMRDSILSMLGSTGTGNELPAFVSAYQVFPNPAGEEFSISLHLKEPVVLQMDVTDISGKQVVSLMNEKQSGPVNKKFNTAALANGNYLVRLQVEGKSITRKLTVSH